ncbi:putative phosphoadenosine phosphosulfate reductase [Caldalkalibacillus thermarum]|uniref:phosphoadenylyl-sulfate reductase n=1 Tax=Caldalkalibacillus thermarum TaxID=296745 RepID=UPI0019886414|nr:phosphoadenylyl-sulfate reductase [Caldalkalibacillus thermarum]GGK24236.1 putative phosphoadenosine phosphosulfate reductase [Caldalkalibacillus thermarum]
MAASFSYTTVTEEELAGINRQLEQKDTLEVIKWAYDQWGKELIYACSFGAEGMVLIDMISKVKADAKVIFLDTHLHFKETYDLIEEVKQRYPQLRIELIQPDLSLEEQAKQYGDQLWVHHPDQCCRLRKIIPLHKALTGAAAWMSGLRREQSPTRAHVQFVNLDHKFQSIKVCPLIHWTWEEVWLYIRSFNLPYNPLHDQDYPSIGCEPCTLPVKGEGDSRAGRWAHANKIECGLHSP